MFMSVADVPSEMSAARGLTAGGALELLEAFEPVESDAGEADAVAEQGHCASGGAMQCVAALAKTNTPPTETIDLFILVYVSERASCRQDKAEEIMYFDRRKLR
jgi:hypothetical protein